MKVVKVTVYSADGTVLRVGTHKFEGLSDYQKALVSGIPEGCTRVRIKGGNGTETVLEPKF